MRNFLDGLKDACLIVFWASVGIAMVAIPAYIVVHFVVKYW